MCIEGCSSYIALDVQANTSSCGLAHSTVIRTPEGVSLEEGRAQENMKNLMVQLGSLSST